MQVVLVEVLVEVVEELVEGLGEVLGEVPVLVEVQVQVMVEDAPSACWPCWAMSRPPWRPHCRTSAPRTLCGPCVRWSLSRTAVHGLCTRACLYPPCCSGCRHFPPLSTPARQRSRLRCVGELKAVVSLQGHRSPCPPVWAAS